MGVTPLPPAINYMHLTDIYLPILFSKRELQLSLSGLCLNSNSSSVDVAAFAVDIESCLITCKPNGPMISNVSPILSELR